VRKQDALRAESRLALGAAAIAAAAGPLPAVLAALAAGLAARIAGCGSLSGLVAPMIPVALFAALLAALQWLGKSAPGLLPLRTLAVFLATTEAVRGISGAGWLLSCPARSLRRRAALFAVLVAHFSRILNDEAHRVLLAHKLAAPRRWRAGWFTSLSGALTGVLLRALIRAERFYAAQWLRGLGE